MHGQGASGGIMVVGQHASEWEDQNGFPFAGKQGQMLRHFLDNAGIHTSQVYRTNVLKCAPPGGKHQRKPTRQELDACHAYLMEELRQVQPKVIITMGDAALQALYTTTDPGVFKRELDAWQQAYDGELAGWQEEVDMWGVATKAERAEFFPAGKPRKPKAGPKPKAPKAAHTALKDVAGHTLVQPDTGIPLIATYHPSFISRGKWGYLEPVAAHFKKAQRLLSGTQKVGKLGDYAVIDDIDKLRLLRDYLLSPEVPVIWFDCETFGGLDWMENEVLCYSFAGQAGEGYVVPLWHNPGNGKPEIFPEWQRQWPEVVAILRLIFESDKDKGGHNVLYDIRETERLATPGTLYSFVNPDLWTALGIKVNGHIIDTELESVAVEESLPHNMTFMLANKTDMPFYEADIAHLKKNMEKVDNNVVWEYSAADADGLPRLHEPLRKQVELEGVDWVLDNITTPMLKVCRTLETNGFPIDLPHFQALCMFYEEQIHIVEDQLWFTVPHLQPGWKYNHSPTLAKVLFQDLNMTPSGRKTEAGKGCEDCDAGDCDLHDQTGKAALEDIMRVAPHPVLPILLRLKKLTKMRSTYLDGSDGKSGFVKHIRADGRIHPTMKISRAETGRLASEKPNEQNMPNYVHIHPAGATCTEVGCTAFYDETFGVNSENAYHDVVKSDKPGWWIMNCLAAGSRVLTADLREVRVEDIKVGDQLVGIDEEIPRKWGRRVMRTATVTNTQPQDAHCFDVHYGGHVVTASESHLWLVWRNNGYTWRRTTQLRVGDHLLKAPELTHMEPCDAGYLAGFLDGEGWAHCEGAVAFGQRPGVVLNEVLRLLKKYNFQPAQQGYNSSGLGKGDVERYTFTSSSESIRLLGSARPLRLLQHYDGGRLLYEGKAPTTPRNTHNWHPIYAIEDAGIQTVYAIETDTHTYVAEGAFQHNCDWSQAEVWVLAYRLEKFTGDRTLLDVLLSGVDIHLWMARQMFPEISPAMNDGEWKKTYPHLRRRAKTCMPPETRVLTGDLRWVDLGSLKEGDAIVAFDEEAGAVTSRRLRRGYVTGVARSQKPLFELEFDDGTVIKTTDDHPFLARRRINGPKANFKWMSLVGGLKRGLKVLPVWDEDTSRDAGWLAGYFDGEGCLAQLDHHGAWAVSANQVPGAISDKAYRIAAERGFMVSRVDKPHGSFGSQPIEEVKILGGIKERLRFLGSVRPERLLNKFEQSGFYGRLPGTDAEIIRVTPIGTGEVVSLETDTHTFIAEGMAVHNCIFGIGYGLTPNGYMQREHCTEEEAEDIINRYMARIPGLRKLFAMVRHHLETQGYEANEFGRRRHITSLPLLQMLRERGELEKLVREAINFPIQSGASDLHSIATYATWLSMQKGWQTHILPDVISAAFVNPVLANYEIDMILTVHDSLSFEFKYENDQQAETIARVIKDMWESIAWGIVKEDGTPLHWKIPVEVEFGPTWGSPTKKVDARGTLQDLEVTRGVNNIDKPDYAEAV